MSHKFCTVASACAAMLRCGSWVVILLLQIWYIFPYKKTSYFLQTLTQEKVGPEKEVGNYGTFVYRLEYRDLIYYYLLTGLEPEFKLL